MLFVTYACNTKKQKNTVKKVTFLYVINELEYNFITDHSGTYTFI